LELYRRFLTTTIAKTEEKKQAYIVQYVIKHGGSALRFAQPALRGATQ
jgi:hypothetical protein